MHRFVTRTLDQPAAGADWSFVPSSSDRARLLSIVGTLTTDANEQDRVVMLTVTDETGNIITVDNTPGTVGGGYATQYSWRPSNLFYNIFPAILTTSSMPGFWLPPGAKVASNTAGLDPPSTGTPASITTVDDSGQLPVTIVTGVNDQLTWTGDGGAGSPATFVIAAGVYATIAAVAAAINAAVGPGSIAFATQALVSDAGAGSYLITAVADEGANGNDDTLSSGATDDAFASIFTDGSPLTLINGEGPFAGDQWSGLVATFIVADERTALIAETALADLFATVT